MKNEAWLVTAKNVMRRPQADAFEFISNTIVRGEHPVAWASRNSAVNCNADGFTIYLLFYAELPAEVADAAEAASWCEVSHPKGERP